MHFCLKKNIAFTESMLLPSIALIPLFKVLTLVLQINFPLQYAPTAIIVGICLLNEHKQWAKILTLNAIILCYCLIAYDFHRLNIDVSVIKNQTAAFVYLNTFLIIFFKIKANVIEDEFKTYAKYLVWTSALLIGLCYVSLIYALVQKNIAISLIDIKNLFLFSRDNTIARSLFIWLTNPVGFILKDYANMKMVGPQLLINPFILFLLASVRTDHFKKLQVKLVLTSVVPLFIALNSRALALTLILIIPIIFIKNIKNYLHIIYILALGTVPFFITGLNIAYLNGRKCQIDFVKNNISLFGNGIGSKQNDLNSICGESSSIQFYQTIKSMTFDNIHIEAIHYFGYVPYLIFLAYFIYRGIWSNSYQARLLYTLIFIFFSLNLNLFEIYFVPIIAILIADSFFTLTCTRAKADNNGS